MAVTGSLQVPHGLGILNKRSCDRRLRSISGSGNSHLLKTGLLPHALQSNALCIRRSGGQYRSTFPNPCRRDMFKCHSFLNPGQAPEFSCMKNAAIALTRLNIVFQRSPIILKLASAVGIIVFTIWGLGPVLRQSRNMFFRKSDSSWKKSGTHYVMTSYLQPLLLWTGVTLICRGFDPVVLPSEASQIVKQRILNFVRSLSTVLALAYCLSSVIQQGQKFFMEMNDSTDPRNMGFQFAGKAIYTGVWVAAVSLFMELLGFSTQKWLTAGGLGTVLLTLAGREIFTNFLSSAMIHATRPFIVNEWIQTKIEGYEVSGTVEHVGWWSPTIVRGEDREAVHIPNHKFTVNVVRNLSQKTHWRIKTHLAISHLDVNKINNIVADMRKVLAKNPNVEHKRLHRRVFLDNVNPENQALLILISCFVKTSHFEEYLCVKEAILLDLLRVISHHRARLATPMRTIQKIYTDSQIESIPFSDSIFSRGAASSRRLLMIEPPYKVNGEEKAKPQTKSTRPSGEQDSSKNNQKPAPEGKTADAKGGTAVVPESKAKETPASTSDVKEGGIKVGEMQNPETTEGDDNSVKPKLPPKPASNIGPANGPSTTPSSTSADSELSTLDLKPLVGSTATLDISSNKQPIKKTGNGSASSSSVSEAGDLPPSNPQPKQENERPPPARPPLEENIILGVALEGSKRTLPIEEETVVPSTQTEAKELAKCGNGSGGSPGSDKGKTNHSNVPKATTSSDQREPRD